jgi:hypothetical protein
VSEIIELFQKGRKRTQMPWAKEQIEQRVLEKFKRKDLTAAKD